jgi:serine/threonine protein kinase
MGTVFEAEHLRLHRRLAIKVLARHLTSDSQALARFRREAEIISHLQHPHIVQLVDYDTTEAGEPYIVMEYLEGETLEALLARERTLSLPRVARIVHQVASALSAAHRALVVHRDLKPGNVFLVQLPGEAPLVKLLDFGISFREGASRRLTGEYDVIGTPHYMSPEQAAGLTSRVDHRADQYSLAVIAYEALAGRTPFPGKNVMDVLRQVLASEPTAIDLVSPHLPHTIWPVLRRALGKDPAARFQSALEFSTALLAATGGSLPPASSEAAHPAPSDTRRIAPLSPASQGGQGRYSVHPRSIGEQPTDPPPPPLPSSNPRGLKPSAKDMTQALARAREAFGLSEMDLAVSYIERALQLAPKLGALGATLLDAENALVVAVLQTRLGSLEGRLVVRRVPPGPSSLNISPEQAFLLSRLEGYGSVEEVLDLSPLPRRETLRQLVSMLQKGVLAIE